MLKNKYIYLKSHLRKNFKISIKSVEAKKYINKRLQADKNKTSKNESLWPIIRVMWILKIPRNSSIVKRMLKNKGSLQIFKK